MRKKKINIGEFNLPDNLKDLKRITKSQATIDDKRFIDLFLRLKKCDNKSVLKLKTWLTLLKEKNYSVDINELING